MALSKTPLSLYVHIPFCVKKCLYCDFLSESAPYEEKIHYVDGLLQEMEFWAEEIGQAYEVRTIFIGGGTPTCLPPEQLLRIGKRLQRFCLDGMDSVEFTIEANPGTITKEHVCVMQEIGVNRVSLGLQSAVHTELQALGRIHTYEEFVKSFLLLRENGFDNINVDLMADIPGQTLESYQQTLDRVLSLEPEHISSYSLIVEEGTPFYQMQQEGKLCIPDEETDRSMYALTQEMLAKKGYTRYEISNYSKKEKECRHNLTYWSMGEYLGMGLGASSYFKGYRFSNICDRMKYQNITDLQQNDTSNAFEKKLKRAGEIHRLSKKEEMEEYVFLGLRMMQGISTSAYKERFCVDFYKLYGEVLKALFQKCLLAESENHDRIYLTNRGIDVSNMVLAEFLLDDLY